MPKKNIEEVDYNSEEDEKKPIRISKKTGLPVRPMSEKQLEALRLNRLKAVEKKKELKEARDYETKTELMRRVKEEKSIIQKEKLENSKKEYEKVLEDTPPPSPKKKEKKIKKKVIKYVEASDSDSEEEEVIIRKKKKEPKKEDEDAGKISQQILREKLKNNLEEVKQSSLAQLLMPSYY